MILKTLIVISFFWAGFVWGGSYYMKQYSDTLVVLERNTLRAMKTSAHVIDELLLCRTTKLEGKI